MSSTTTTQKKLLVIFGATGQQGSSVLQHVLCTPSLASKYTIRAITRNPTSPSALAIKALFPVDSPHEMVAADTSDPTTLLPILKGANTVFLISTPPDFQAGSDKIRQQERENAVVVADACKAVGSVEWIIYSTLPAIEKISGGKYRNVGSFDGKADAEGYIRELCEQRGGGTMRCAFVAVGSFMQNWNGIMKPRAMPGGGDDGGDKVFTIARHVAPEMKLPLIDITDTGKWVGAILARPEEFEGKVVCAAHREYSMQEIAEILSKSTGEKVVYKHISVEDARKAFGGSPYVDLLIEMMLYQEEFGYYGEDTREKVKWGNEVMLGKATTLEEYLEKAPVLLE